MNKRTVTGFFVFFASLLLFAVPLVAEDGPENFPGGGREHGSHRRGGPPRGGFFGRTEAEMAVAEKYPAEAAELDKQLLEIEKKYEELAKQAGVNWPASMETNMRKLRVADPEGFRKAMETMKKDRRSGMTELMELAKKHNLELMPMGGGRRGGTPDAEPAKRPFREKAPNLSQLRRKYPQEMKEYEKLKKEDPEKAKQFLMELMNR